MSQENVELVRRGYGVLAKSGGLAIVLDDLAAPDCVVDLSAAYPDGPVLQGIEQIVRIRETAPWGGSLVFEPEEFVDVDAERVLVFGRSRATGQCSGLRVEASGAHL